MKYDACRRPVPVLCERAKSGKVLNSSCLHRTIYDVYVWTRTMRTMRKHDVFFFITGTRTLLFKSWRTARVAALLLLLSNRELPSADAVSRPTASRCRSECCAQHFLVYVIIKTDACTHRHYYTGTTVVVTAVVFFILLPRAAAWLRPLPRWLSISSLTPTRFGSSGENVWPTSYRYTDNARTISCNTP